MADIIRGRQQQQATRINADGYLRGKIGQEPAEFSPEVSSPSSNEQPIEKLFTHGNDEVTTRVLNIDSAHEADSKKT